MCHCSASKQTHLYHSSEHLSCPAQAALLDACALVLQPDSVIYVHILLCSLLHSHQGRLCTHCRQSPCLIAPHDAQPYGVTPLHYICLFNSSCVSASFVPVLDSSSKHMSTHDVNMIITDTFGYCSHSHKQVMTVT